MANHRKSASQTSLRIPLVSAAALVAVIVAACGTDSESQKDGRLPNDGRSSTSNSDALDPCLGLGITFDAKTKDCGTFTPCPAFDCERVCPGANLVITTKIGKNLASTGLCVKDLGCVASLNCSSLCPSTTATPQGDAGPPVLDPAKVDDFEERTTECIWRAGEVRGHE